MKLRTIRKGANAGVFGTLKSIYVFALMLVTIICLFSGCSSAQQIPANDQRQPLPPAEKKVLIVYLSRTGNTRAVAEIIRQKVGGTIVPLELETPYPADYDAIVRQVARENETGYLPPLKTRIDRVEQYDYVFLGFPTWGMRLPPPMKSFLNEYNLSGKKVIPFNTNAGYGTGSSFGQVKQLCPNCTVLEGFEIKGGIERDGILFVMEGEKEKEARAKVEEWLQKIGVTN